MLFEYAIIERPHKKEEEKGEMGRVIVEPTTLLAKDKEHAKTLALLQLGKSEDAYDDKRIEVLVRPFV